MATPRSDARPDAGGGDEPPPRGTTALRVLGVSVMLGIALLWIWIFSGAPARDNPDRLEDRAWAERAEARCAATMSRIDERAATGERPRAERADAIDASTAELRAMVAGLGDPLPSVASDRELVAEWLGDWRDLIDDRDTYAEAIRADPDARFTTSEKFNDPLDTVIEVFADVNDMPSCGPAGDVG